MTYKVFVDDNFHYMGESERYELGDFPTLEAAIEAARKIVDEYLVSALQSGVTPQALLANYLCFGEDPYIVALVPAESGVLFSGRDYARGRCYELCQSVHDRANDG
jgi:hypothetical protein